MPDTHLLKDKELKEDVKTDRRRLELRRANIKRVEVRVRDETRSMHCYDSKYSSRQRTE